MYGGGNAAPVPGTNVIINGGDIARAFAGGNGESGTPAHVGYNSTADSPESTTSYGSGITSITLYGGTVVQVFGGSNSQGLIRETSTVNTAYDEDNTCELAVTELYGGGNEAEGNKTEVNIGCFKAGAIVDVYGGSRMADINSDIVLNINGGHITSAFGGNNISGDISGTITVNVEWNGSGCDNNYLYDVYGGGNMAAYTNTDSSPLVNIKNGTVTNNVFGGGLGSTAKVTGNPVVTVGDPDDNSNIALVNGNVYGGGSLAEVEGATTVNVRNIYTVITGNVFGAGLGDISFGNATLAKVTGTTTVDASAGKVKGNIYGGGQLGAVDGTANVTIRGTAELGYVESEVVYGGKVFGAGLGDASHTDFATVTNTNVTTLNAEDAVFNNNVYGGGELGVVSGTTNVTINSGTLKDVYGAGQGQSGATGASADIQGSTQVTINGGSVVNAYGGGQNGTVHYAEGGAAADAVVTTVNVVGGTITSNVFGGGDQGTTQGRVIVNMNGGTVKGELFAGAKGTAGSVFVAGLKTVNMRGGIVENHVYGGSRNANDGMDLDQILAEDYNANGYTAFVNISAGEVRGNVYGAGYYGNMFGSSDINIGKEAIDNANTTYNIDKGTHTPGYLHIFTHIYAGSNWGEYNPVAGFGRSTTTGRSNIYLDGKGYDTQTTLTTVSNYMSIDGSLYGSGTSCDAGTQGRKIQIANYGVAETGDQEMEALTTRGVVISNVLQAATRTFESIQRCDTVIIDNSSVEFSGQGDISQNSNTAQYAMLYIDDGVWVRNGSNIVCNMQIDEIHSLHSEYRPGTDLYAKPSDQTTYWIGIGAEDYSFHYLTDDNNYQGALPNESINSIRFNDGYALYVRYTKIYTTIANGSGIQVGGLIDLNASGTGISDALRYGELCGFFRMATSEANETFAHARPKRPNGNTENNADGGFMSYYNAGHNIWTDLGLDYTKGKQFPYTNVVASSKDDRPDYRFWQIKTTDENLVNYDAVLYLYSQPDSEEEFLSIEYVVELPSLNCTDGYYELCDIDFGDNIRLVDGAIFDPNDNSKYYIAYTGQNIYQHTFVAKSDGTNTRLEEAKNNIRNKPNTRFGLVVIPDGCLADNTNNSPYIISNNAKPYIIPNGTIAGQKFYYPSTVQGKTPKLRLRVTYYKELTQSVTLAPVILSMKSYCTGSTACTNDIRIMATFTTQTALGQDINTTAYAMYDNIATGNADETYKLKVTFPAFIAPENSGGRATPFYIYQHKYAHDANQNEVSTWPTFMESANVASHYSENSDRYYAVTYIPANNADNKNGWAHSTVYENHELITSSGSITTDVLSGDNAVKLGEADGRMPFSMDFTLHYNSTAVTISDAYKPENIGTITFKVCYPITAETLDDAVPTTINDATTPEGWDRFDVTFTIYKKTNSRGFFLDGIKGDDTYSGYYADYGMKSIQGILDNGWTPGDHVLVVRPITVTSNMVWSNSNGYTISMYRYPGGTVNNSNTSTSMYNGTDPGENTGHNEYQSESGVTSNTSSAFFTVNGSAANLNLDSFILDGMYGSSYPFLKQPNSENPDNPLPYDWSTHPQNQQAPLINILNGTVTLSNCELRYSQNEEATVMGGAINVADGATLNITNGTVITNNKVANNSNQGGGIYVEDGAEVNLSGLVTITGNKDNDDQENNVYLEALETTLVINKSDGLDADSRIGIYKTQFYEEGDLKDLSPIATSAFNSRIQEAYINGNFTDDTRRGYVFHYFDATTLYLGKTWAHYQTTEPNGFALDDINSAEDLAWFISCVNGLNGQTADTTATAKITADIPGEVLGLHYWLPIENFKGTFDGQWYKVDGLTMKREGFADMGLFGHVTGDETYTGIVKNVLMTSANLQPWNPDESIEQHVGGIAGRVSNGGIVTGCQALPTITAADANRSTYIGGVVGDVDDGGLVHSVIGMPTLTGYTMGGIAGKIEDGGDLYNSYSNIVSMTSLGSGNIGGLVGYNLGTVENNYSQMRDITIPDNFGWLIGRNASTGLVKYCYAPINKTKYINNNEGSLTGHGNYDTELLKRKQIGYLYFDNTLTIASGQTNTYHSESITYTDAHIDKWSGMVSALDQWAKEKNAITDSSNPLYGKNFARWFRPGTSTINDDLPVLGLYAHNTMAAANANNLVLDYGKETSSEDNSLDALLTEYSGTASSLFVFDNATEVTGVPSPNDSVFIHEDAVLLQSSSAKGDFKATVGVSFDNSYGQAHDYFQGKLEYDWHLMSSPLQNAPMGTTYNMDAVMAYGRPVNLISIENGYFPNGLPVMGTDEDDIKWDFYAYDEPDYHWINFKRSTGNHWHIDTIGGVPNPPIHYSGLNDLGNYENETILTPGKGYMMAISQDSYFSNTGLLNKGNVSINVTAMAPNNVENKPTYDKGSNLVGNPYQAYLDLDKVKTTTDNTFISGFYLYIADSDTGEDSNGLYVPYSSEGSSNPATPSRYIHPHQGFFIVTDKSNTQETLTFTQDMAGTTVY